jgi:hypothetical protein
LQFVQRDGDGKLFFRSFHTHPGTFLKEDSGPVRGERASHSIWTGMNWKFRVLEHIRHAVPRSRYVPASLKPGSEVNGYFPAVRARLTIGGDSKEVWLKQNQDMLSHPDRFLTRVTVGGETFEVGYSMQFRELPFELKLLRAEQDVDPGTQSPATYTSYVQLTDRGQSIIGEDRVITMNEPLDQRGFKVYQSGYDYLGADRSGRPVNRSTFTVGRDPGLYLKYAGTFMLAGGIACMFYMRAYFFKPRGRPARAPSPSTPSNHEKV